MHLTKILFFASVCLGPVLACEAINSFDAVKSAPDNATGGSGGDGGSDDMGGSSAVAGTAGTGGSVSGGSGGVATGGKSGAAGAGATGGAGNGGAPNGGAGGVGGSTAGTSGAGGSPGGGAGAGGSAGDAGAGGTLAGSGGSATAGSGGTNGGSGGMQTGGGGNGGTPPLGLIVVGGSLSDGTQLLRVINPDSGATMGTDEMMTVVSVSYDGVANEWYILENTDDSTGIFPLPSSVVMLHARHYDPAAQAWTEDSKTAVPVPYLSEGLIALNQRLAYLGYNDPSSSDVSVIIIDTSTLSAPAFSQNVALSFTAPAKVSGLTGIPKQGSASAFGGTLDVIAHDPTGAAGNDYAAAITVTQNTATLSPAQQLASFSGTDAVTAGIDPKSRDLILAVPPATSPGPAQILRFSSLDLTPGTTGPTFTIPMNNGGSFTELAAVPCDGVVLVGDLKAARIYAVPLDTTKMFSTQTLENATEHIVYEPTDKTILSPSSLSGSPEFQAFTLDSSGTSPVFSERTADWAPGVDIGIEVIAVKQPFPPVCQ